MSQLKKTIKVFRYRSINTHKYSNAINCFLETRVCVYTYTVDNCVCKKKIHNICNVFCHRRRPWSTFDKNCTQNLKYNNVRYTKYQLNFIIPSLGKYFVVVWYTTLNTEGNELTNVIVKLFVSIYRRNYSWIWKPWFIFSVKYSFRCSPKESIPHWRQVALVCVLDIRGRNPLPF